MTLHKTYVERKADEIYANDQLRQHFTGGRVEVCHGAYDIDDRTMGRMLTAVANYNRFEADSWHDDGILLFGGFTLCWKIEKDIDETRVMRVWVNEDALKPAC